MTLMILEDTRHAFCNMKTLNLLSAVIASQKALEAGVDEAVLHRNGMVTECTHSNIFIITKNNELKTAPISNMILPGVARAHLINACKKHNVEVIEKRYSLKELCEADEIIVTSSSKMAKGVKRVDGKCVGGKDEKLLKKLQDERYLDYLNATSIKKDGE